MEHLLLLEYLRNSPEPHVILVEDVQSVQWRNQIAQDVVFSQHDFQLVNRELKSGVSAKLSLSSGIWVATKAGYLTQQSAVIVLRCLETFDSLDVLLSRSSFPSPTFKNLILRHDWASTRFGPIQGFSKVMRDACLQCLCSEQSVSLCVVSMTRFAFDSSLCPILGGLGVQDYKQNNCMRILMQRPGLMAKTS